MIELLKKLISFQTTADNPEEIKKGFEYIASLFDSKIFEVQNIEHNGKYSQLIAFRGKDTMKPRILLNGHFDVVPAEDEAQYHMRVEGNKAFGRGTADMKGMLTVLIEVMQELALRQAQGKDRNLPDVALLLNGDEEVAGENGAGYAVKELGVRPQFVLCADATHEQKEIIVKEKGGLWLELQAQGKTAHAAYLWKGENAIDKLFEAIQKIKGWIGPVALDSWKSTVNLASVETSNKTPNKVPADARAVLDIRFTEELAKTPEELLEKIRSLVPGLVLNPLHKVSLLFVDEKNLLLQKFKKISDEFCGVPIPLHFEHGATDARYFGEIGIPTIIFGAVGGNFHAAGEWVDLESLETNKKILLKFLENFSS